jgi:hypothetical protein
MKLFCKISLLAIAVVFLTGFGCPASSDSITPTSKINGLIRAINDAREVMGRAKLEQDPELNSVAKAHATWLRDQDKQAYQDTQDAPNTSPDDRIFAVLGATYTQPGAEAGHYGWESRADDAFAQINGAFPGVLTDPNYTHIGVGCVPFRGSG